MSGQLACWLRPDLDTTTIETRDRTRLLVKYSLVPLGVVTAIGAAVRVQLMDQVMRHDEVLTLTVFATDLRTALTDYSYPNNHILHTILVWASTTLFGAEAWATRVPALISGVSLIVAVYWWISSAASPKAGLLAAALTAGSSMMIEYSTIARGYMILTVAFVVLMELSRRLLRRPSRALWAAWIGVSVGGFLTVPVFAFPLAAVLTWVVINVVARRGSDGLRLLGQFSTATAVVGVLSILLYVPAALTTGIGSIVDNDFVQSLAWSELPENWIGLSKGLLAMVLRDDLMAAAYVPLIVIGVVLSRRTFGSQLSPVLAMIGPLALIVLRRVSPPQRVWLFAWPLFLGVAATGLHLAIGRLLPRIGRARWLVPALAVTMAAVMGATTLSSGEVLQSREAGTFRDGPETAELLAPRLDGRDRVVVESHPRVILDYYLTEEGWSGSNLRREYSNADRLFVVVYHPRPQDLEGVLAQARVPEGEFTRPDLRWELPETDIYVMRRIS